MQVIYPHVIGDLSAPAIASKVIINFTHAILNQYLLWGVQDKLGKTFSVCVV